MLFRSALGPRREGGSGNRGKRRTQDGFRIWFDTAEAADTFTVKFDLKQYAIDAKRR